MRPASFHPIASLREVWERLRASRGRKSKRVAREDAGPRRARGLPRRHAAFFELP